MRPAWTGRRHYAWVVVATVAVVALAASGVRSAFGVFIKPMEAEFGWDRTTLSLVASLAFLFNGAAGPVMGRLADRWGPRGVLAGSGVLLAAGALGAATVVSLWQLYLTAGVLMAVGSGGIATSVTAAVAARWFDTRRGLIMGVFGGGVAAGQLLIGSAVGAAVGGHLYDRLGDYTVAFHSAALVAFSATVMVLAIRDRPKARPEESMAVPAAATS